MVNPGDEVVFLSPPWFYYEAIILASGATRVRVRLERPTFDLDVEAIVAALGPRTRAVIVNTPHNPTGRIYPAAALQRLAEGPAEAAQKYGRPIGVISDEAHDPVLFDGRTFPGPGLFTRIACSSAPTAKVRWRRGNGSASSLCPRSAGGGGRSRAHGAAQLQYRDTAGRGDAIRLPDVDRLLIDVAAIERRRDRMVTVVREQGYEVDIPEGTVYLLPRGASG